MLHGDKKSLLTTVLLITECREQARGTKCAACNDVIDSVINGKLKDSNLETFLILRRGNQYV